MKNGSYVQTDKGLVALGLSVRLAHLYGVIKDHVGNKSECWPSHATLGQEIGVTSRKHVIHLLKQLRDLKLIAWKRTPRACRYRVLEPDLKWIAHWLQQKVMLPGGNISDVTWRCHKLPHHQTTPDTTEARSVKPGYIAAKKPNLKKSSRLDDEQGDPAKLLALRMRQRHGPAFDVELCLRNVNRQLERAGLDLADFERYDRTHTTGQRFTNEQGYYVHLAQALVKQTRMAVRNGTHAPIPKPPEPERDAKGRCAACSGSGVLPDGAFCGACPLGRDLAGLAKRPKSERAKPRDRGATA